MNQIKVDKFLTLRIPDMGLDRGMVLDLKHELIKALKKLSVEDRDVKSLTIYCNPNFVRGPDYEVQEKVIQQLTQLISNGCVMKEISLNNREVYTIVKKEMRHE
ncbi:MAG: hypothetical protein ACFFKA_13125 [Candidatus Thorarchaeota archaeon]